MMFRALIVVSVLALSACSRETEAPPVADAGVETPAAPASGTDAQPDRSEAPAPRPVEASATHCRPGERALYNCPFEDGRVASFCAGETYAYRYGPLGRPELEITRAPGQAGIWQGGVVGQGGGQQTHVRFQNEGYDYVVFSGYDGRLADNPGREYSGVVVMRNGEEVRRLDCPVTSHQTETPSSMIPNDIPAEEPGNDYDVWF